ncbi:MAG: putative sulfate exporter family transporter [Verrucomicrobiota bacterium]
MATPDSPSPTRSWFRTEDFWAILLGLGLVIAAAILLFAGSSLKWLAVMPAKWTDAGVAVSQLFAALPRYLALFAVLAVALGLGAYKIGLSLQRFLLSFAVIFAVTTVIILLGAWSEAGRYTLEPPLVALAIGLVLSNTLRLPAWLNEGLRVEYYVKLGIVLLGATLPLNLLLSAGPVAMGQAAVISLATFGTIFFVARRLGLDQRFAATLGAGGAVCGVSASIAVAGAVGAKKEQGPVAITIVVFWAIVMVFALPLVSRWLGLSTGVAGAWIGTSEFADAAGFAAAQTYGGYAGKVAGITGMPDDAVNAFTLMKVIGRDLWVGIWAFVLSFIAVSRWSDTGVDTRVGAGEVWRRFPKFVIGFILSSLIVAWVASGYPGADFKRVLVPELIDPLKNLRVWAFTFCFLSIGLSTRWRDLAAIGRKPFLAFTAGVIVNVILGYFLSVVVFGKYWSTLGH